MKFDAFEVGQVADFPDNEGGTFTERVNGAGENWEEEAIGPVYWTVYAHIAFDPEHRDIGGVDAIRDFPSQEEAVVFAEALANGRPVYID